MSREIKFRAWDKRNNKWIYGPSDDVISPSWVLAMCSANKQEPFQYTGLKDKNGVEIYEGDICSTDLDRPYNVVVFRNGAFTYQCHDNGKDYFDLMMFIGSERFKDDFTEVIGNIHENPELLEESQ